MAKKKSSWKKKLGKAAALGLAGYAAYKGLGKRKLAKVVGDTHDEAGLGVRHNAMKDFGPYTHKRFDPTTVNPNKVFGDGAGFKGGGIAKRGTGAAYKSGGRVKSMGIAKRGGGAAKR